VSVVSRSMLPHCRHSIIHACRCLMFMFVFMLPRHVAVARRPDRVPFELLHPKPSGVSTPTVGSRPRQRAA